MMSTNNGANGDKLILKNCERRKYRPSSTGARINFFFQVN